MSLNVSCQMNSTNKQEFFTEMVHLKIKKDKISSQGKVLTKVICDAGNWNDYN